MRTAGDGYGPSCLTSQNLDGFSTKASGPAALGFCATLRCANACLGHLSHHCKLPATRSDGRNVHKLSYTQRFHGFHRSAVHLMQLLIRMTTSRQRRSSSASALHIVNHVHDRFDRCQRPRLLGLLQISGNLRRNRMPSVGANGALHPLGMAPSIGIETCQQAPAFMVPVAGFAAHRSRSQATVGRWPWLGQTCRAVMLGFRKE
ncbi:hypothetical protein VTK56DRAFT_7587 [Thermocarpiscus australiensis]